LAQEQGYKRFILLKTEFMRQYNLLKDTGVDDLPKKSLMKGNIKDLEDQLDAVSTDGKTTYPLWFDTKRYFVQKKIALILDNITNKKEKGIETKMQGRGAHAGHDNDQDAVDSYVSLGFSKG
jgi:hypothetical protein